MTTILSNVQYYLISDDAQTAEVKVVRTSDGSYQTLLFKDGDLSCSSLSLPTRDEAATCAVYFGSELNKEGYAIVTT